MRSDATDTRLIFYRTKKTISIGENMVLEVKQSETAEDSTLANDGEDLFGSCETEKVRPVIALQ